MNYSILDETIGVNPAAYLSEINQKGNLQKQAQYNGKDSAENYSCKRFILDMMICPYLSFISSLRKEP